MKITFLGTNGWFDTETGATISAYIDCEEASIILDAGFGIRRLPDVADMSRPAVLLLSHLHLDHTVGLHLLNYFKFESGLKIIVPAGQKDDLMTLYAAPYTAPFGSLTTFDIEVYDTDELEKADLPFKMTALPLVHTVPDYGFRMELEGKIVTYATDTGLCENAVTLSKDADLVITECGCLPGECQEGWPHMDPFLCAELGIRSGCKQMLLTHFGAGAYDSLAKRKKSVEVGRKRFPNMIAASDGMDYLL